MKSCLKVTSALLWHALWFCCLENTTKEFQLNKCLDNISLLLVSLHVRSLMFILLIPGEYLVKTGATWEIKVPLVGIPHRRTLNPLWKLQLVTQIINDGLKMKRIGFVSHHSVPVGDVKLFITEEDLSAKEILQRCEDQQKISQEKNNFLGKCFRDIYNSLFYVPLDRRHRETGKHYILF